jgi:D-3-phosphoglycerate dehydrogenase
MSKHKVLVVDNYSRQFFAELAKISDYIKVQSIEDNTRLSDITILVIRSKTKVTQKLVDGMPSLQLVISSTHGCDHVCVDYLREKGIRFYNVPVQSHDVAQGVIAYILAHSVNLVEGNRSMKRGEWKKNALLGGRIEGKTLGVIGYGRIGEQVAKLGRALGMTVVTYDPYKRNCQFTVPFDTLLTRSDYITVHVPLTNETKGMIGKTEISKMKRGAYLINTARGSIIDQQALLEALRTEKISGAALDVYEPQLPFDNEVTNRLVKNERVIATPHSIGQSAEAMEEKGRGVIKIIRDHVNDNSN